MRIKQLYTIKHLWLLMLLLMTAGCNGKVSWEQIIKTGELRFATFESPATYYEGPIGPAGFEYELAKRFADSIGVSLKIVTAENIHEVISLISDKKASISGASLMITEEQAGNLKFGPAYYSVPQQLVYKRGADRPLKLSELDNKGLDISAAQPEILKDNYQQTSRNPYYGHDIGAMLRRVHNHEMESTVANSQLVNVYKHLYPEIRVAFNITKSMPVAWLYDGEDKNLDKAIRNFFAELEETGELDRLIDRHFGHFIAFDYIDTSTFLARIEVRLPEFEELFKNVADKYNLDWTLLAAMSYQESHWQQSARSPTGVRGLMMLTQDTAEFLGVNDRVDPEQSVDGGARYFMQVLEKIPERITAPDRTWLALAAYNVGIQHLEHARVVTQMNGGNPDRWSEVRQTLLNLGEENSYPQFQSGQVRWNEPARYVRNIRKYRDILRWLSFEKMRYARENERLHALSIDSPVL